MCCWIGRHGSSSGDGRSSPHPVSAISSRNRFVVRHAVPLARYAASTATAWLDTAMTRYPPARMTSVRVGRPAREVVREALAEGIHPGYALGRDYPGMDDVLLVALTERRTVDDIERLAAVLSP